MSKPRIAVVLSGCGVFDGAEIHETVLTLLEIARQGGEYVCFAPNIPQHHVVNHLTGQEEQGGHRNVLTEAARIARGEIKDLKEYAAVDFDALIFPGGFGVAKNLSTFALDGPECWINPDVERAIKETHAAGKPMGALCAAPILFARALGNGVKVTVGDNPDFVAGIESMGGVHEVTTHGEVVVDETNRIVTTPCYMLDATITQISDGAHNAVAAVMARITR